MMSQPTFNALSNTQDYLNQFKNLDKNHLGYLNVAQVKAYFKSQQLPEDDLIELASHSNQGRLTPEQFASVMNLSEMKKHGDVGYHSSKFSSILRHCEEAMKLVEKDRRLKVPTTDSKDMLLKAFKALEDFMKQFIQSLEEKPQVAGNRSLNKSIASSTFEKMPGSFDFDDNNVPSDSSMTTYDEPSMQTTFAAAPVSLKDSSFNSNTSPSPHAARQYEKEPTLDLPSPLPQMNDAATDFMSGGGLKPISNRNLNGDDAQPNNAHENDTLRSNVLDSLRNAALNDTELEEENDSKEREILSEGEPRERTMSVIPSARGTPSTSHAMQEDSVKPTAFIPRPDSFNQRSSDDATSSQLEPTSGTSGPHGMNAEEALVPLAASVATVAAATAAAAAALSDNDRDGSYSATPLDTASKKANAPETLQGGLGDDSTEPFIKNAKDTDSKPQDQTSFGAEQAKKLDDMLNGADDASVDRMNAAPLGTHPSSLPNKLDESNQFVNQSKPFERETFQGGLGGNGTEPYIKNEKDTLLKPQDQPSFGTAEQERMSKLDCADEEPVQRSGMEQPHGSTFVPESFQGGLGGDGTEPYIKNEKDTLLRPEDQPSFGAQQDELNRRLSEADNKTESTGHPKDTTTESSPSYTLAKMGAGAAGMAGAAAAALGLSEHSHDAHDKNNDSNPLNDASGHNSMSPRNVYSPSLTSGNSLEDISSSPPGVISNEALDNIADKVDADVEHIGPHDESTTATTTDKDGIISSDALDKIADHVDAAMDDDDVVSSSASMDVSPGNDVHVLVEQETSLPPNLGHEVEIETANNDSNRSPLSEEAALPSAMFGSNDSTGPSSGLNNDYMGGSSTLPDSTYRVAPHTSTAGPHYVPSDAASAPQAFSSSRSLTPNDANKDNSPKDSPKDDADNKDENPGFFKRLFGARSKSPEPASRSIPADSDETASKESTPSPVDKKAIPISPNAPIFDKIHAFNVNVPQAAVNVNANSLSNNATEDNSPNVDGADTPLGLSKINVNESLNTHMEKPNHLPHADDKLETTPLGALKMDNSTKSPEFNANANVDTSDFSSSLEKASGDIKDLSDSVPGKFGSSVDSPDMNAKSLSFDANVNGPNADPSNVHGTLNNSLPSLNADVKSPDLDTPSFDSKLSGSATIPDTEGKHSSLNADFESPESGLPTTTELPSLEGNFEKFINTPDVDSDVKSPSFGANTNLEAAGLSSSLGKMSAGLKELKGDFSDKSDGAINSPSTGDNLPSVGANVKSPSLDLTNSNAQLDDSIETPGIEGKLPSFHSDIKATLSTGIPDVGGSLKTSSDIHEKAPFMDNNLRSSSFNADMERPDLSGSLGEISSFKDTKKDISGNIDGSMETPDIHGESSSLNTTRLKGQKFKLPDVDYKPPFEDTDLTVPKLDKPSQDGSFGIPDVDGKLDRSINTADVAGNAKSPDLDAKVSADGSSSSGSLLGKLSSGLKNLKDDISGALEGSAKTSDTDGKLSSVNAKISTDTDMPDIDDKIPSQSPDLEAPKLSTPSVDADIKSPDVDLPNLSGSADTPDINTKLHAIEGSLDTPDVNVDASRPSVSGLGKLSSSFKGLKDSISGKFNSSTPDVDGELPSLNADIPDPNGKLPDLDAELSGVKLGMPSVDGKLTNYMDPPTADAKLPTLDTAGLKKPDVSLPNVSGKLDKSISAPDIDSDAKISGPDVNLDVDTSGLSGSLGKLSAGLKDLQNDISGKFDDSVKSPHAENKLPSLDTDIKGPSADLPAVGGSLDGSIKTPDMEGRLPSLGSSDITTPHVDVPNVDVKLDRSMNIPSVNTELPSMSGDIKTPDVNLDTDADANRPSLTGAFEKVSSSFKGLTDSLSGKLSGDMPSADGELPSVNADLDGPNVGLPRMDSKTPSLATDLNAPNLEKPSLDGSLVGSLNTPSIDGKLPSVDMGNNSKAPNVGLPHVSGKFDRSIHTPEVESDMSLPDVNANVNADTSGLSGSLGKLSADLKGIKDNISGKLDGVLQSPHVEDKAPNFGANIKSPSADLPNVKGTLDGSFETPDVEGKLPTLSSDIKSFPVEMPQVGGNLDTTVKAPESNGELPSANADLKSPDLGVDVNVDRPDLSGSFGKLSSSFKDIKDGMSGKLSGELPSVDGEMPSIDTNLNTPKLGKPSLDANLSHLSGNMDKSMSAPDVNTNVSTPGLNTDVDLDDTSVSTSLGKLSAGLASLKGDISARFDGSMDTPDADGTLPAIDANLKGPDVGGKLDSTIKTPDMEGKLPSVGADLPKMSTDLNGSISTPDTNANLPSLEGDINTPNVNLDADVNASRPSLGGSLGKLSSSFKDLKRDISGKFDSSVDTPNIDKSLPTLDADIKGRDMELPDIHKELPSLHADVKGPSADLPDINKDLPSLDADLKTPKANLDTDVDGSRPSLSGSLGKLSSSFKDLKKDISGKFDGSVDTPDVDKSLPSLNTDLTNRDVELPDIHKELPSLETHLKTPKLSTPSVDADIKSPDVDLPNLSGSADTPDINTKLHAIEGSLDTPDVNVDASRPSVSGLGKLSSSFKGLKDSISGKLDSSIDAEGKLPTAETNLNGPFDDLSGMNGTLERSIKTPGYDGKLSSSLDAGFKAPHVDMSPVDGKYDGPSLNAELSNPQVDLPNVSGKLDRSLDTPALESDLKSPEEDADADVNAERPSLSGALGKLSSSFKGLKDDITGVFSGSADTPDADDKLPTVNTDYTSSNFGLPDADLGLEGSIDTPKMSGDIKMSDMDTKLSKPHVNTQSDISGTLPSIDGSMTAPKANVDVPDLHSQHLDASVDSNVVTAPVAPPRKTGISGSLGKMDAALTSTVANPKNDVDVPQADICTDVLVAPPRSPRLSLNKPPSEAHLNDSSSMDIERPETSSQFKGPNFNVHINDKPLLEGDLSTGLHPTVSDNEGISAADKTQHEGDSSSFFFSKPKGKMNAAINSFTGEGDDGLSQEYDEESHGKNNKTTSSHAHLRTRSRTESPEDLSAMLDDIVKRRFSDTPSESDVSSLKSDKKNKSASGQSRKMGVAPTGLNAGVSEPHASPAGGDRPRSFISDSRFKELNEQEEGDTTEYSTPLTSPVIPHAAAVVDRPSTATTHTATVPAVTLDKVNDLESDVEKQLDAMSASVGQAPPPQVPAHEVEEEEDQLASPSSKTHRYSASLQSTSFQDRSAADAIKSVYDHMTSKLMTGGPKSGNGTDEDRVLKVRDGFENFNGFGVKCVSDNEDDEKHTAAAVPP